MNPSDPNNPINHGSFLLTIDVEDWFQVENFKPWIPYSSWPSRELRVERNTHRLLDLLDSAHSSQLTAHGRTQRTTDYVPQTPNAEFRQRRIASGQFLPETDQCNKKSNQSCKSCPQKPVESLEWRVESANQKTLASSAAILKSHRDDPNAYRGRRPRATFFVLAWIAERLPHLVREIHARGHEVASHGYGHELCYNQSPEDLRKDLIESKHLLEDIIGAPVYGYRAPSFSINDGVRKIIEDCGYLYDSSYNSFSLNRRYGKLGAHSSQLIAHSQKIRTGDRRQTTDNGRQSAVSGQQPHEPKQPNNPTNPSNPMNLGNLVELPISNLVLAGRTLPWGGGGYFRLIPSFIFRKGVESILKRDGAYVFYMHPWEIDPKQPRVEAASWLYKFRHYTNLKTAQDKLSFLIKEFADCEFLTCSDYLKLEFDESYKCG